MTHHLPGSWRAAARRDLAAAAAPVWAGIFVLDLLGLAAITAQVISLASAGSQAWASHLAWLLAGLAACAGTAAAGIRIRGNRVIRQTWLLYALGAGCWTIGALVRISVPAGQESLAADILFLCLPVCCITTYARRVPRPYLFLVFLLDALPVVLLLIALTRLAGAGSGGGVFGGLFTGLYVLLAANAVQMVGIHRDLPHMPVRIWLFTGAFCVMALASLFAEPHKVSAGNMLAVWVGSAWTLGMLMLGAAGVGRILRPSGFVVLLPAEKQSGPHAIPPTIAVLGLIVMLTVTGQPAIWLRLFVLSAALILLARIYLVHRADLRLIADVERSRERLRLLAEDAARLKSLILDELLQTFCEAAREVLGVRGASFGLAGDSGFSHFAWATGGSAGLQAGGARPRPQATGGPPGSVPRPEHPVPLTGPTREPGAAGFAPGQPLAEGFLAVPVVVGGAGFGVLYLAGRPGGFSEEDQALAGLLATSGGQAIVNAGLYAESRAQQDQLAAQNERLRELDRLKDEFIALVSHELRTPLTSIIGYIELLRDAEFSGLETDLRHFAEVIDRNAHRLLNLVGDLLFLSRIQSGKMAMDFGETDLAEIAARAVEEARPQAQGKRIALDLHTAVTPRLICDPARIAQLLDNLISNALKFTPAGGRVEVRAGPGGAAGPDGAAGPAGPGGPGGKKGAIIEVADSGIGIPAADQERIFERFFRGDEARRQAYPGTGLGLTITKAIVDAHNGAIAVDSTRGQGTTFRVWLPLRPGPATGTAGQDAARRFPDRASDLLGSQR